MQKIITVFTLLLVLLTASFMASCDDESDTPTPTDYQLKEQSRVVAEEFVTSSPTVLFDAIEGTLQQIDDAAPAGIEAWKYSYQFKCTHPGYGDRSGDESLKEETTYHEAVIKVSAGEVKKAVIDNEWDMIEQEGTDEWTWGEAGKQAAYGVVSVFAVLILLTLLTMLTSSIIRKMESKNNPPAEDKQH